MKTIDCRGLACPAPVLTAKESIEAEDLDELTVLVDNEAAKRNVSRFLESRNFTVSVCQEDDVFHVTGKKKELTSCEILIPEKSAHEEQKIMILITTDTMGHGDDELGSKLMANFLKTLKEMGKELWRLVFINNGVKLTVEGSKVLPDLKDLENQGISILVCGTCLTHFNMLDKNQVGETTNMLDIVTSMQLADKVIDI